MVTDSNSIVSELGSRLVKARSQLSIHSERYEDLAASIEPALVTVS
jgi:hypothetical protein